MPGHQVLLDVLRMLVGPLALTSANRTGGVEAVNAREVLDVLGNDLDLVIDDGPCRFGEPSSVVRIHGNRYEVLRAGVVPEKTLQRLSSTMILFVCTGNTCRSPMAELICRQMLARRLGCEIGQLEDRGVLVMSAGVAAMLGGRAAAEAVEVLAKMNLDLSDHETQPLTEPLVRHADLIYTMTRTHREAIVAQWPAAAERTFLLCARRIGHLRPDRRTGGALPALRRADPRGTGTATRTNRTVAGIRCVIVVGTDHRGFPIRARIIDLLRRLGHDVEDVGTYTGEAVDYPDIAARVARKVSHGEVDRGILICGTGLGMCITANKFPGVRAAALPRRSHGRNEPPPQRRQYPLPFRRSAGRAAGRPHDRNLAEHRFRRRPPRPAGRPRFARSGGRDPRGTKSRSPFAERDQGVLATGQRSSPLYGLSIMVRQRGPAALQTGATVRTVSAAS